MVTRFRRLYKIKQKENYMFHRRLVFLDFESPTDIKYLHNIPIEIFTFKIFTSRFMIRYLKI